VFGTVYVGAISMFGRGTSSWFCLLPVVAVVGVIGGAAWAQSRPRLRGLAMGLWIGFGVSVLVEGVCFGIVIR
jgi:hypothetical protein